MPQRRFSRYPRRIFTVTLRIMTVTPAQAGAQVQRSTDSNRNWVPASAGTTLFGWFS